MHWTRCFQRLKSPSNQSGPDKVPTTRELPTLLPWMRVRACPVFLQSSTIEEAEGAEAWRVTPRQGDAGPGRGGRAAGRRCSRHFGSSDRMDLSVCSPEPSLTVGHTQVKGAGQAPLPKALQAQSGDTWERMKHPPHLPPSNVPAPRRGQWSPKASTPSPREKRLTKHE